MPFQHCTAQFNRFLLFFQTFITLQPGLLRRALATLYSTIGILFSERNFFGESLLGEKKKLDKTEAILISHES